MKLPTIPPGLAGKIVKKPPALGTNQIAGFGGFRPLASLEKNKKTYFNRRIASEARAERKLFFFTNYLGFVSRKNNTFKLQRKLR